MAQRRVLKVVLVIGVVVVVAAAVVAGGAAKPPIPAVEPPSSSSFSQAQIDRGEALAGLGDCAVCHTADAARPFAGGVGLATGFGTVFSANITPDPDTGIGRWSQAAFARALREGVARDGSYLFPAFPYDHFTRVSDDDVAALYAYLMTRDPVSETPPANTLGFPYNIRLLQAGWQWLYFDEGRFEPANGRSDAWNRGAYLAEGLGHCGACHTPRNALGAELPEQQFAGAVIDDWYAPALDSDNRSRVAWTADALVGYLRAGGTPYHGVAIGSMSPVVHEGLDGASDGDLRAIATYFADLGGHGRATNANAASATAASVAAQSATAESATAESPAAAAATAIETAHERMAAAAGHGEQLFATACASCHYNVAGNPSALRPELSLNSAVSAPDPVNLIRATLEGVSVEEGMPGAMMPAFDKALSDDDLASLVSFLRATQSDQPPWTDVDERIRGLRGSAAQ